MTDTQVLQIGGFIAFVILGNYVLAFAYVFVAFFVCPPEYTGFLLMTCLGFSLWNKFRGVK